MLGNVRENAWEPARPRQSGSRDVATRLKRSIPCLKRLWSALTFWKWKAPRGVLAAQGFRRAPGSWAFGRAALSARVRVEDALAQEQVERNRRKASSLAGRLAGFS